MILAIRVLLFETQMLIESTIDTPQELHRRWHVCHRAYQRAVYETEFCTVPRRVKADLKFCKKILTETREFMDT